MATATYTPRLKDKYKAEVVPALQKRFNYKSSMQVPRLEKISINRGVNGAGQSRVRFVRLRRHDYVGSVTRSA